MTYERANGGFLLSDRTTNLAFIASVTAALALHTYQAHISEKKLLSLAEKWDFFSSVSQYFTRNNR